MKATEPGLATRARRLPRTRRRLLVLQTFLAYPAVIIGYRVLVETGLLPIMAWIPIVVVLIVGLELSGLLVLTTYVGHRADAGHPSLDERQRALAIRAQALSYSVLAGAVVVAIASAGLSIAVLGPLELGGALLLPVGVMVAVYLPALPTAILAWIDPDAPPEDEPIERPVGTAS